MRQLPDFRMRFEPSTIDHLGLRLYSTLPPVITELVSNAWDAEAQRVDVQIPTGPITKNSEVIVRDYGHGMNPQEIANEYLPIGRARRGSDDANVMSKNGKRRVTGRKGLGKLSAFGVATEIEVRSVQDGTAVCLRLDYDKIKAWADKQAAGNDYRPDVVKEKTGPTNDADGLSVTLRRLRRKSPMSPDDVRRGLARRLQMIGPGFQVTVNATPIGPGDRVSRAECDDAFSWDHTSFPRRGQLADGVTVTGWIGFLAASSQANRGVDIFAHGKAVELGSFFNYPSTHAQFARAHVVGEIHGDFLDGEEDLASTARNSVVWETEIGQTLQSWGHELLRWAFDEWVRLRKKDKEEKVIKVAGFDKWLATRPPEEQKVAKRMVKLLIEDEELSSTSMAPILEIVKSSVESVYFRDLVDTLEKEGVSLLSFLRLFDDWRVIEAREHLRLADGRSAAIGQLEGFMRTGALEVQELQPLFDEHPWLVDPAWKEADRQVQYTELLRKHCKEARDLAENDRRLDIFAMRSGGNTTVVELKRPEKTLARLDLDQIETYVDWARDHICGTGPDAPKHVSGLLLVGHLGSGHKEKLRRLAGDDIRVETFADLCTRAKEYYGEVERRLQGIAPEYTKNKRRKRTTTKK